MRSAAPAAADHPAAELVTKSSHVVEVRELELSGRAHRGLSHGDPERCSRVREKLALRSPVTEVYVTLRTLITATWACTLVETFARAPRPASLGLRRPSPRRQSEPSFTSFTARSALAVLIAEATLPD